MKHRIIAAVLAVMLALLLVSSCGDRSDSREEDSSSSDASEKTGILSKIDTVDLNGVRYDETIFAGHYLTMLNVWATYCGPCLREMPYLGELSSEYSDKGVQIIGLVGDVVTRSGEIDESQRKLALEIASDTGAVYTHLLPGEGFSELMNQLMVYPTTIFINSSGEQVGSFQLGALTKEAWEALIDEMLGEVKE